MVPDILYGEERIKRPLIRVGERGEGKFRECSWEEAVDKAAELLKKPQIHMAADLWHLTMDEVF